MSLVSKAGCGIAALTLLCAIGHAQTKQARKPADKDEVGAAAAPAASHKTLTQEQQRALYLLDQLFDTAKAFTSDKLKIRAQAQIADSLWDFDEPRARDMFTEAFNSIFIMKQPGRRKGADGQGAAQFNPDSQLRIEVLQLIARRDLALAEGLSRTVIDVPAENNSRDSDMFGGKESEQAELYLELAMSVVQTDPARAAQLARRSLDIGMQMEFPMTLMMIRDKDQTIADDLFLYALATALKEPGRATMNIASLGPYVFPDWGIGMFGGAELSLLSPGGPRQINPNLVSQFLEFAYNQIIVRSAKPEGEDKLGAMMASMDYMLIMQITPYFDKYMPEKALEIRARMGDLLNAIPSGRERDQMAEFFRPSSVNELIDKAEKSKTEDEKSMAYLQAIFASIKDGDYENSLSLVQRISNPEMRSEFGMMVRMFAALAALAKGDTVTALQHAREMTDHQEQVAIFGAILNKLVEKNDNIAAGSLLIEAEKILLKSENTSEKAGALLSLAASATRIDSIRGFEIMKSAVDAINRAKLSANQMDQFTKAGGDSGAEGYVTEMFGFGSGGFSHTLPALARIDFEHALMLAKAIDSKEGSVMAQLAVCRGALTRSASSENREKDKASPAAGTPAKPKPEKGEGDSKPDATRKKDGAAQTRDSSPDNTKVTTKSKKAAENDKPQPPSAK